jgi:predicted CXXCH cytochrome family protein
MAGRRLSECATIGFTRLLGTALILLVGGCTVQTRYQVLTFFFEGVPPPGSKPAGAAAAAAETRLAQPVSFHSTFRKDQCTECHVDKTKPLIQPIPDLCWKCHPRPSGEHPWNHAPERVGDCLACHVGHETMMPRLLVVGGQELCHKCHRAVYVELLPKHKGLALDACLSCHPYHEGGTRAPEQAGKTAVAERPATSSTAQALR